LTLKKEEVISLHGPSNFDELPRDSPKVCLGPGTGLGECYLIPDGATGKYRCFPSEGGHVDYAPRNDLEMRMVRHLSNEFQSSSLNGHSRISVERVVSGKGLASVYRFLAEHGYQSQSPRDEIVYKKFNEAHENDQPQIVSQNAKSGDYLCKQAIDIMCSAYGCEASSAALKWIPTGGLFLTGGVTAKNVEVLKGPDSDFMKSYLNKGRQSFVLEKIPLFAVKTAEDLGVRGVHEYAKDISW